MQSVLVIVKAYFWIGYETIDNALDFLDLRATPRGNR